MTVERMVRASRKASAADTARRILGRRLTATRRALEAAGGKRATPRAVHGLRVASRRAIAALSAFRELVPRRHRRWFRKTLRRLRRAAGEARDVDVVMAGRGRVAGRHAAASRGLADALARRRRQSRRLLRTAVAGPRLRRWEERVAEMLAALRASRNREPIVAYAGRRVGRVTSRFVARFDRDLRRGSDIHRLRIAGKKLRYVLETFAEVVPGRRFAACLRLLRELQDRLGEYTDHAAAAARLDRWSRRESDAGARRGLVAASRDAADAARKALGECAEWWNDDRRRVLGRVERTMPRRAT